MLQPHPLQPLLLLGHLPSLPLLPHRHLYLQPPSLLHLLWSRIFLPHRQCLPQLHPHLQIARHLTRMVAHFRLIVTSTSLGSLHHELLRRQHHPLQHLPPHPRLPLLSHLSQHRSTVRPACPCMTIISMAARTVMPSSCGASHHGVMESWRWWIHTCSRVWHTVR